MRGQLGVVEVLEAGEHFQIFVKVLPLMLVVEVSHAWMPQVLVEQRDVLLDGGREVTVVGHVAPHALAAVVVELVQYYVYSLLQVAPWLAV